MDLGLPDNVTASVESLAKELAKHNMAADIKISTDDSYKKDKSKHEDSEDGDDGMCEELKGLLESWDDTEHPYYKDVEKIVSRYDGEDEVVEEKEEEYFEEE